MAKSKKRIDDLEYNVYKNNLYSHEEDTTEGNKGCVTVAVGIVITLILLFLIAGSLAGSSYSAHCAYSGCGKKTVMGSNYCWQHGPTYLGTRKKRNTAQDSDTSSSGSITDGSTSSGSDY